MSDLEQKIAQKAEGTSKQNLYNEIKITTDSSDKN